MRSSSFLNNWTYKSFKKLRVSVQGIWISLVPLTRISEVFLTAKHCVNDIVNRSFVNILRLRLLNMATILNVSSLVTSGTVVVSRTVKVYQ